MPRFIPQLLISLRNSTDDKSRRASARTAALFPTALLLVSPTMAGLPADCTDNVSGIARAKLNMGNALSLL